MPPWFEVVRKKGEERETLSAEIGIMDLFIYMVEERMRVAFIICPKVSWRQPQIPNLSEEESTVWAINKGPKSKHQSQ